MALTCRDVCKSLPLFLFFWGLRVTDYHGSQQISSETAALSDTNHKLQLMGVLGASEGLRRTSHCSWLLLKNFCYSVVGDHFRKNGSDQNMKVIQKVQETSLYVCVTWPRLRCRMGSTSKLVVPNRIVEVPHV